MSISRETSPSPSPWSDQSVIDWLLSGDVSVAFQTRRDLLDDNKPGLRRRISSEGWGAALLKAHHAGGWGHGFYQPKWISTHYTLLDLRLLELDPAHPIAKEEVNRILQNEIRSDGGVGPGKTIAASDVCVNGMVLNYASWFGAKEKNLARIVDFLIGQHMADGGFNCLSNRPGARHSSMHSTISVLEGIAQYLLAGHRYRKTDLTDMAAAAREFLLIHRLFRSDRTDRVIRPEFLRLPYPWRWKYNILRALDHFRLMNLPWDDRLQDAVAVLLQKRRPDGRWPLNAAHPGEIHIVMEPPRSASRWNTLIASRILRHYGIAA